MIPFLLTLGVMTRAFLFAGLILAAAFLESKDAGAGGCYRIWADVEGTPSDYRHFVYVRNDCDYWLQCTVWTDVNPQPPHMMTVAPDATENTETNGNSERDDPRAFGSCRRK